MQMQMPLFTPTSGWRPTPVSQLPSWAGVKRLGIDSECFDPKLRQLGPGVRRGGYMVGVSFAFEDGPSYYLPIRHPENNLPPEHVLAYLREQAANFDGELVGANIAYDLDYWFEAGIKFPKVKRFRDVQVADPLINELQDSYSLEAICQRHGLPGKQEGMLRDAATAYGVDPKAGLWQLPARFVGEYATWDAILPLRVLRRQEREIEAQDLWQIYDLETRLTPVLLAMRRRGVAVDFKRVEQIEQWSMDEERKELAKVFELTGCRLSLDDVNKSAALVKPLSQIADIKFEETANGKPSVDKEFLKSLKSPIADAIIRARKLDKVRNTFCASVREHACNGRIHATFNQMRRAADDDEEDQGARYGRLSCTDPNLQQQPARDPEVGKIWRSIYIPDDGKLWFADDYSQQEPRLTIHYAVKAGCTGALEYAIKFRNDPNADSHTEMTKLCWGDEIVHSENFKRQRGIAKEIFLGVTYSMGGAKLCHKLNLPTVWIYSKKHAKMIEVAGPEGQAILDQVDQRMPFLRQLARLCEARASAKGYIVTLLGRRCRFPMKKDGSGYDWVHKALNRLIQGSAADQTKKAVVEAAEAGHNLQLQVHDEVDGSGTKEEAEGVAEHMRNCVSLEVPSKVDVELGKSWGDSM